MKFLNSKFFNFLIDLVSFFSLGLALPIGIQYGFCYIFGWSEISQRIGFVLGTIIGFPIFLFVIKRTDDEYSHDKTVEELRALERRYNEKSTELERACKFLTLEQKHAVFFSETSTISDSTPLIETTSPRKSAPLHYCYIVTVSLIISAIFFVLFSSSDQLAKSQDESSISFSYATDNIAMYCGSKNSDVIHKSSCRHAKNISEENRVYYKSVADAKKDGRTPCSVCLGK